MGRPRDKSKEVRGLDPAPYQEPRSPNTPQREEGGLPRLGTFLLVSLTLFWGLNWPIMKIVLMEVPPWTFRTLCLSLGGVGLLLVVKAQGLPLTVPRRELKPLILVAGFNITGWHLLSAHGLLRIHASRAAIIAFTMPIWAALFSALVLREPLKLSRILGLGLGIAGLGVLIGPDIKSLGASPAGVAFMLGAAVSWGMGTVAIKFFKWTMPVSLLTAWQLILGGIPVLIGAALLDTMQPLLHLSTRGLVALSYVILLPIIYCQWAWFKVVSLFPATVAAIGTLVIPVLGVLSSALILSEPVGLRELAALLLVLTALALVLLWGE